jgi:cell filamentation protein
MIDPYIDPKSGILRNKFGSTEQASLNRAETSAAMGRSMLLKLNPLKGDFDSARLKAIHFYLFQDVYDWAGQFRTVPLAKAGLVEGGRITRFTSPELIESRDRVVALRKEVKKIGKRAQEIS